MEAFDLSGRLAVVTGGNRGIGLGMARGLVAAGATVAVWARDEDRNRAAVAELEGEGGTAAGFGCDVTDPASVVVALEATVDRFGDVHALFANAGVGGTGKPTEIDDDEWNRIVDIDLTGVHRVVRPVASHMRDRNVAGSIVLTASIFASRGLPYSAHYAAAKGGVLNLGRALAIYLARHGIRVNVLSPGWVATEMTGDVRAHDKSRETILARTPLRRWGSPEDYAGAAVFLASDASSFMTGAELVIDGGYSAG